MNYTILFTASSRKTFLSLESGIKNRIAAALRSLTSIPRPSGVKKLKGFTNLYRIRVSDYRIVYTIDDSLRRIEIARIDLRENIYR